MAGPISNSDPIMSGHKPAIVGLLLLHGVASFGVLLVVLQLAGHSVAFYVCASLALYVVGSSMFAAMTGVAYYLLRFEKDGIGTDELAAIFD